MYNDIENEELRELVEILASAIRSISHGGISGPTGIESLTMAIAGEGMETPLSEAVMSVAEGLNRIADAIEGLKEADK